MVHANRCKGTPVGRAGPTANSGLRGPVAAAQRIDPAAGELAALRRFSHGGRWRSSLPSTLWRGWVGSFCCRRRAASVPPRPACGSRPWNGSLPSPNRSCGPGRTPSARCSMRSPDDVVQHPLPRRDPGAHPPGLWRQGPPVNPSEVAGWSGPRGNSEFVRCIRAVHTRSLVLVRAEPRPEPTGGHREHLHRPGHGDHHRPSGSRRADQAGRAIPPDPHRAWPGCSR